jgi:hypothetical protein
MELHGEVCNVLVRCVESKMLNMLRNGAVLYGRGARPSAVRDHD